MIKLSDFVFDFLVKQGLKDIFLVSGGGIMHLTDSVKNQSGLNYICNHHEQACAIAAESYARFNNKLGVCLVTTGPGSTNALSGIAGAWVDSLPVLVISGQVRRDLIADYTKLRQYGPQEINIIDLVKPVTKYAKTIMDPSTIKYELEYAIDLAFEGRKGPVWLNIPLDVQAAMIDETTILSYHKQEKEIFSVMHAQAMVQDAVKMLYVSERPVLLLGAGVRLAGAESLVEKLIDSVGIPVLTTIGAIDLIAEDHPMFFGRIGPIGQRRANFTLQNADLIISLGASMSVGSIGFNTKGFAPLAKKIMVNIDPYELNKPSFVPDLPIHADLIWFLEEFLYHTEPEKLNIDSRWLKVCESWKTNYPTLTPDYFEDKDHVNSYVFAGRLSEILGQDAVLVTGLSLDIVSVYHSFKTKASQRVFTNINYGSMGWDLPAVVGACIANGKKETTLITGDGTIQFNIQELNTISINRLPIKIFILNNQGYESIRSTQNNYFNGNFIGSDAGSGIGNPDFSKLAEAYKFSFLKISNNEELQSKLKSVFDLTGPVLCEINLSFTQGRSPKIVSFRHDDGTMESKPLEDQFPFIPRKELYMNMHMFSNK